MSYQAEIHLCFWRSNVFYQFVLPERVRARIEEVGRVELSDKEANAIVKTKLIHVVMIVLGCLSAVRLAGWSADNRSQVSLLFYLSMFLLIGLFWIAGILEAFGEGLSKQDIWRHVATTSAVRLLSLCLMIAMVLATTLLTHWTATD
eukprot:COSAG06_NODE_827_length_12062_cov_46.356182_3_plen_147_part_00